MQGLADEDIEALEKLVTSIGIKQQNILDGCTETQIIAWVRYALLGEDHKEIAEFLSEKEDKEITATNVKIRIASAQMNILRSMLKDVGIEEYVSTRPELEKTVRALQRRADNVRS